MVGGPSECMSGNGENPRDGGVCCLSLKMGKRQKAYSAIRTTHLFLLSIRAMPLFLLCHAWRETVKVALRAVCENEQSWSHLNTVNRIKGFCSCCSHRWSPPKKDFKIPYYLFASSLILIDKRHVKHERACVGTRVCTKGFSNMLLCDSKKSVYYQNMELFKLMVSIGFVCTGNIPVGWMISDFDLTFNV